MISEDVPVLSVIQSGLKDLLHILVLNRVGAQLLYTITRTETAANSKFVYVLGLRTIPDGCSP